MKLYISFFVVFLMLFYSVMFAVEARPLNCASIYNLSLNAVKAGPSPGEGHKFTNVKTLGGIKMSGPSPGEGQKFTNVKTLTGIKMSGPSLGDERKLSNAQTFGGNKKSGEGNKFTNAYTLGGVKESGPSPGAGH
ncbi:Hypothetical predicted protein [Olea europaea subsp. europaea]|uniref:Uncharacterized protein n=1 Tax=Olea europaea subsp. europaea TaxID=158383 RepID=A0A8S0TCJ1_OLEEU|nr:Hypothetical predicted protein [Olea europaea subsp. europaea]